MTVFVIVVTVMAVAVKAMLPQKLQEHYIADNKNKINNQMNECGHNEIYILYMYYCTQNCV